MELIFNFVRDYASWVDSMALFVVFILVLRNRNLLTMVIFVEFVIILCIHEYLVVSGKYSALIMQYIYGIGIKDIAIAFIITLMSANLLLRFAYAAAGAYMLLLWVSYYHFYQVMFLDLYAARGTFVTMMMLIQVYGLTQNGGINKSNKRTGSLSKRYAINRLSWPEWSNANAIVNTTGINSSIEVNKGQG